MSLPVAYLQIHTNAHRRSTERAQPLDSIPASAAHSMCNTGLAQSDGSVPVMRLLDIISCTSLPRWLGQPGGRLPDRELPPKSSQATEGKAPGRDQDAGRLPVRPQLFSTLHQSRQCTSDSSTAAAAAVARSRWAPTSTQISCAMQLLFLQRSQPARKLAATPTAFAATAGRQGCPIPQAVRHQT